MESSGWMSAIRCYTKLLLATKSFAQETQQHSQTHLYTCWLSTVIQATWIFLLWILFHALVSSSETKIIRNNCGKIYSFVWKALDSCLVDLRSTWWTTCLSTRNIKTNVCKGTVISSLLWPTVWAVVKTVQLTWQIGEFKSLWWNLLEELSTAKKLHLPSAAVCSLATPLESLDLLISLLSKWVQLHSTPVDLLAVLMHSCNVSTVLSTEWTRKLFDSSCRGLSSKQRFLHQERREIKITFRQVLALSFLILRILFNQLLKSWVKPPNRLMLPAWRHSKFLSFKVKLLMCQMWCQCHQEDYLELRLKNRHQWFRDKV